MKGWSNSWVIFCSFSCSSANFGHTNAPMLSKHRVNALTRVLLSVHPLIQPLGYTACHGLPSISSWDTAAYFVQKQLKVPAFVWSVLLNSSFNWILPTAVFYGFLRSAFRLIRADPLLLNRASSGVNTLAPHDGQLHCKLMFAQRSIPIPNEYLHLDVFIRGCGQLKRSFWPFFIWKTEKIRGMVLKIRTKAKGRSCLASFMPLIAYWVLIRRSTWISQGATPTMPSKGEIHMPDWPGIWHRKLSLVGKSVSYWTITF